MGVVSASTKHVPRVAVMVVVAAAEVAVETVGDHEEIIADRGGGDTVGRSHYSANKRRREADKARKKREKAERRQRNREQQEGESEIATIEEIQGAAVRAEPQFDELSVVAPRQAPKQPSRLFVGGLARGATDQDLIDLFSPFGDVQEATVVMDANTGESRGFGFVTMLGHKAAGRAIEELNNSEFQGRRLFVDRSNERSKGRSAHS